MNEENKDTVNISDQFNSIQLFFVLVCSKLSYCDSLAIVWRKKLYYNERKGKEKRRCGEASTNCRIYSPQAIQWNSWLIKCSYCVERGMSCDNTGQWKNWKFCQFKGFKSHSKPSFYILWDWGNFCCFLAFVKIEIVIALSISASFWWIRISIRTETWYKNSFAARNDF